jgi:site-specific recombinase XerD
MPRRSEGPYIYQRPGRRGWYAYLSRDERHISLETDDEDQARLAFADLLQRRAASGDAPAKGELGPIFVACAHRARTNHAQKYAYDLNLKLTALLVWLEGQRVTKLAQVDLALVERFKADHLGSDKLKARSVNRYLDAWKKAMRHAVDEGRAPKRVLDAFRKLKEPRPAPHQRGLTMEEINSFLCAVDDERDYWHFRAVAGSGIRDDEARHLLPDSAHAHRLTISPQEPGQCECHPRGWTTKNFRYRDIPISAETAAAARSFAVVKHSLTLDQKSVWKRLQAARKRAGHDWQWSMHELRRAWASHLLADGHKLADISRWCGHADVLTTMRYLRVIEDTAPDPASLPL